MNPKEKKEGICGGHRQQLNSSNPTPPATAEPRTPATSKLVPHKQIVPCKVLRAFSKFSLFPEVLKI